MNLYCSGHVIDALERLPERGQRSWCCLAFGLSAMSVCPTSCKSCDVFGN